MAKLTEVTDLSTLPTDELELLARARVAAAEALEPYEDVIFYERPNWRQHLEWIIDGREIEIVAWADDVMFGSEMECDEW